MKIKIIGAGPAGLYFAGLMKRHDPPTAATRSASRSPKLGRVAPSSASPIDWLVGERSAIERRVNSSARIAARL